MINKDEKYWQNKIIAWMNETPIKDFDIANRDKLAKDIRIVVVDADCDNIKDKIMQAEKMASGLTRAVLPADDSKLDEIIIKHPLVKNQSISVKTADIDAENLKNDVIKMLKADLQFADTDKTVRYKKIFNYLFFAFCKQLRKNNIGNLGACWDILPADTRIPDHPIWHHLGMTSAIFSSLYGDEVAKDSNISMVVYSITPVQDFIAKARKLRDYWVGSVLLSYLAFVGITKVIETLGPDHILYPSLQNQALVDLWLGDQDSRFNDFLEENDPVLSELNEDTKSIAAFPNKFVFICNNKDIKDICNEIKSVIDDKWKNTANLVKDYIAAKADMGTDSSIYNDIFDRSVDKFWKYSWAATDFISIENEEILKRVLSADKYKHELGIMKVFDEENKKADKDRQYDVSRLYGATHSLTQGLLASGKMKSLAENIKNTQSGEKCPLCGEHQVLNNSPKNICGYDYNKNIKTFWQTLAKKENPDHGKNFSQIGENERLCAICSIKRFLPMALRHDKDNILHKVITETYDNFPSTTEMSAHEFLATLPSKKRDDIADILHNNELSIDDELKVADKELQQIINSAKNYETKYYAFLLMDGDKMGDLINGQTIETKWNDVTNIREDLKSILNNDIIVNDKRTINPALHSMISDALNNFARYGVQPAVKAGEGRLIYAGGDDVCAILPLSKALDTADKIRQAYQLSFAKVTKEGLSSLSDKESINSAESKIVMNLGHSDNQEETKISLSGAIIIAHHKQPLKEVIQMAHRVLDGVAKDKSGRNSLAIRLAKRSGGLRDTWFKWEEKNIFSDEEKTCINSFKDVIDNAGIKLSASVLYKIENLKQALEPMFDDLDKYKEEIIKVFEYEVAHSIISSPKTANVLAKDLAGICIKELKDNDKNKKKKYTLNPEAAIIANFLATAKSPKDTKTDKDKECDNE